MSRFGAISKALAAIVIVIGGGLYVLANHSTAQTVLNCPGEWRSQYGGPGSAGTAHVVIELYRPWIVWAETDGNAWFETPSFVDYVPNVRQFGHDALPAYAFLNDELTMRGGYQSSSGELTYRVRGGRTFVGQCG